MRHGGVKLEFFHLAERSQEHVPHFTRDLWLGRKPSNAARCVITEVESSDSISESAEQTMAAQATCSS